MATERKTKSRRKMDEMENKPTKDEYAVAKFLRFNVPVREGKLVGMSVQCFYANKAIDALLTSKWSASKRKKDPLFTNKASCVSYCNRLLQKGLFHRAEKAHKNKDRDKIKKKKKLKEGEKEEENADETVRERKKKDKKGKKEVDKVEEETGKTEDKKDEKKSETKDEEKKKKDKKLKLSMHDDQRFIDGDEIYVWIYDPVPIKTFLIGLLMVIGAIALCLFPLWPEGVRVGVYYISLAGAGFVGFILSLVVVRLILFCIVWTGTIGRHYFWLLPNLTEDVGFFDSFKPFYKHEYHGKTSDVSKDKNVTDSKEDKAVEVSGKGDNQTTEVVEKDDNSGSDKSENGEFEIVNKDELSNGATDSETCGANEDKNANDEENNDNMDEEDENEDDFDDDENTDDAEQNTDEKKKDK